MEQKEKGMLVQKINLLLAECDRTMLSMIYYMIAGYYRQKGRRREKPPAAK